MVLLKYLNVPFWDNTKGRFSIMKITKRVIASLLATLMVMASLLTVNVFAAEEVVFPDVADDYAYKNAIYKLVDKGIIKGIEEEGVLKFKPDKTITRAEFAKMLAVYLIGDESLLTATTAKFPDCTTHWANKFIAHAVNAGIINGYEDGTFRPDNPVKYGEAIKMLVCAKGYGKLYETTDPWYKGYIDIATDMKLTNNALADGSTPANRGIVAQLVYNMDYTKVLNVSGGTGSGSGGGGLNFKEDEEDYEEEYGVVVGVFNNTLTGEKLGLNKFQIMIEDTVYKIVDGDDIQDYYKYLGKTVEIEYIEDTNELVRIEESGDNDTITIAAEDIFNVTGSMIEFYDEDDEEDEAKLSDDLYVIYNGQGVPQRDIDSDFIEEYFDIDCGEITLMDNNGGKDFEIAYVTSYETFYVTGRSVNKDNYTFTDSYANKSVVLKNDDEDYVVYKVTEAGGKKTASTVSSIASSKVVLSVAAPLSDGVTEAIVSTATLKSAEVDGISGYDEIEIKNKEYSASRYYLDLLDKDEDIYSLKVGDKATFYLDYAGRIVYMTKSESTEPYGYIMAYGETGGFGGEKAVMIFDATGKINEYPLKSEVKVNGVKKDAGAVAGILEDNAVLLNEEISENFTLKNATHSQLVKFTTSVENGKTVVSEILTIDPVDIENGEIVPGTIFDGETKLKCSTASGSTRTFVNSSNAVQFVVNSSTTVFLIPDDRLDEDEYKKRTYSNFYSGSFYNIEAYDIDKATKAAKVVLVYAGGSSSAATILENVQVRLIENITSVKNPDDSNNPLTQVSYYTVGANESELKKITTEDEDIVKDIAAGDLVRFAVEDGELVGIQEIFVDGVLYDHEEGLPFDTFKATTNKLTYKYANDSDYFTVIYGTVDSTNIDNNELSIVPIIVDDNEDYSDKDWSTEAVGSAKFYDYDEDEDEILTDITLGSLTPANNGTTVDAVNASKVVIIKRADRVEGVYLVD